MYTETNINAWEKILYFYRNLLTKIYYLYCIGYYFSNINENVSNVEMLNHSGRMISE